MPPKPFNYIAPASFIVVAFGLFTSVYKYETGDSTVYLNALFTFRPFNFSWFDDENIFENHFTINIINLLLSLSLLIGALLYIFSKHRETLLVRFIFSLVLLSKATGFVMAILYMVFFPEEKRDAQYYIWTIVSWLVGGGFLYLSYRILQQIRTDTPLDTEEYGEGDNYSYYLRPANKWQRIFHVLLNGFVGIMLFWPIFRNLMFFPKPKALLESLSQIIGERPTIYLLSIIASFIYYMISENLTSANPAQVLSGTRVTNADGEKPAFSAITKRTLSRFIPFDGLSFLFGTGWHDQLSQTLVVKEKRSGVNPLLYASIIPLTLVVFYGGNMIKTGYKENQAEKQTIRDNEKQRITLNRMLNEVDKNTFLRLTLKDDYSGRTRMFLKVEHADADKITFSEVVLGYEETWTQEKAEAYYTRQKNELKQITIPKKDLSQALFVEREYPDKSKALTIEGQNYAIKSIEPFFAPNIQLKDVGTFNNRQINIYLLNKGWNAVLTDINVVQGDVKIITTLPRPVYSTGNNPFGADFSIIGTVENDDVDFKINFTVVDTLGRKHRYEVAGKGNNGDRALIKLK